MQLTPLYRVRFSSSRGWQVAFDASVSSESQSYFPTEGKCEGRIEGAFQGTNHPHRRADGTFEPNFQGIIETTDGAAIYFDYRGYGRAYPAGRRQIVATAFHLSEHENYRWLNDSLAVGVGEVRTLQGGNIEIVIDWSEIVWEPIPE